MNAQRHQPPQLSVSIVTFNSALPLLRRTLESLAVALESAAVPAQVWLVDNASDVPCRLALSELLAAIHWPAETQATLCQLEDNRGYGGGHNAVLAETANFHLVLNPDVELAADALSCGLAYLQQHPRVVLLSPRAEDADGRQEFLCKRYPSLRVLCLRAFAPGLGRRLAAAEMTRYEMSDVCGDQQAVAVPLVSGCFMLLRGDALRAVNGFDARYFMYFEDFDLSLRLAGQGELRYLPGVRIVHHGGYAARKGWRHLRMFAASGRRFFSDHGWRWL